MNYKRISICALVVFAGMFLANHVKAATLDTEEQAFVDLLNDYRKSLGRTELKVTKPLLNGADYFAEYLADHPDDADVNIHKDGTYGGPEERGQHYGFYFLSENMGWGYVTGQEIFDAWKASTGHRDNMINSGARTVGISRVYKPGQTKDGVSTEWYWIADFSDEGVERLLGNNLVDSEMYSSNYRKITINIKKWSKKKGKYQAAKWAEAKVYDQKTGHLLDHDIGDKKGNCKVYVLGSSKKITLKIAKFKGNSTSKFTIKGKKVKSKKIDLKKNMKYSIKIK